jgi:hypothetical protein
MPPKCPGRRETSAKRVKLSALTTAELVQRFTELAAQHGDAIYHCETARANRIYPKIQAVADELKFRQGDQRAELLRLYDHPNIFVRLKAAKATLAVEPLVARDAIQKIADSKERPAAFEAGMSLAMLDEGIYTPS